MNTLITASQRSPLCLRSDRTLQAWVLNSIRTGVPSTIPRPSCCCCCCCCCSCCCCGCCCCCWECRSCAGSVVSIAVATSMVRDGDANRDWLFRSCGDVEKSLLIWLGSRSLGVCHNTNGDRPFCLHINILLFVFEFWCPETGAEGGRGWWRLDVSLTAHPFDHMVDPKCWRWMGTGTGDVDKLCRSLAFYSRSPKKSPIHVIDNDGVIHDVRQNKIGNRVRHN